jgi:serine/threonine protein kinase
MIDFGLAVLATRTAHLTESGNPVGTLAYMPPEQAGGEWQPTTAADVYALGAALVYASTGHLLYSAAPGTSAVLGRITSPDVPPDLTGVPPELAGLFGAMVAFDPRARPELSAITERLLEVATAGGASAADMRARLTEQTYVDPDPLVYPDDLQDPLEEDTGTGTSGETGAAADLASPPGIRRTGRPPAPPPVPRQADVSWLVGRLRAEYARVARF